MNAPIVHGGGVTAAAAVYGGRPEDWLDLSTGINPIPAPLPEIPARAWHRLPDRYLIDAARSAAQAYYRSGDSLPLPVPGTQSVIQLLPRLLDEGSRVAVLTPTYGEYERAFRLAGYRVDRVGGIGEIGASHRLAVIVNPNNPDGRTHAPDELAALCERMGQTGGLVVVDEAFGDTRPWMSAAPHASRLPNLIVFRSFGKFFGLAGLRLGFVVAAHPILDRFENWLGPWAVSGPALAIADALLRQDTVAIQLQIAERSNGLRSVLDESGLRVVGGTDLFSLVDHNEAAALHEHLCRHHILVRKFDYAPNWLRFGLPSDPMSQSRLAAALKSYEP
ncbi:threonine-phosphate decarboxylase CobD [Rhizobium sp. Root1220]|uniref:threonine-phosphate decarboxylase CobD n=1 Tax=Rhizobium sp. Root1220 TaxID=1736432 RepID=UPI0006FED0AF|nr:threonine-phosphate decarboxylase CobD [Rhizobium sp. Root1220]KQV81778.1 threonine-phosphate decarboxylase [Rhizobium sp. Root1220]